MTISHAILKTLSDGAFHSGERLAAAHQVTRAAVWKAIKALGEQFALDIHSVRGRGYRLAQPVDLLDKQGIVGLLHCAREVRGIEVFLSIDSTNTYLMQAAGRQLPAPWVVLAEHQRGGRGRRGRIWHSPFAGNIYLSLSWRFLQLPANIIGLSLALGVVICRYLAQLGVDGLALKWPNDILCQGRKLCGLLVEMHGETNGPYDVVIGVGLNVAMPASAQTQIDQPYISLSDVLPQPPTRNRLAAGLIDALIASLHDFETHGFESCLAQWHEFDALRDQPVTLHLADRRQSGIARGIDAQGALLVEHDGRLQRYYSGEISLRAGT